MTRKLFITAAMAGSVFFHSVAARAQINPADRIQAEQQRLIEEEFRRGELENALKRPVAEELEEAPATKKEPEKAEVGKCLDIKTIEFSGNSVLSSETIDKAVAKYKDKCLTLPQIDELLQDITNLYINAGYVTSRAFMQMPQKRLKEGVLEITIVEGKISAIDGSQKAEIFTAFPGLVGQTLNIRDIEQGLEQMNRLASNQAKMDICADPSQNGASKVNIANDSQGRTKFTLFGDNAGSESTGETRFGFRSALDNLFGANDQINVSYTKSPSHSPNRRDANAFTLGASIPYGYWTLNNNFSWSDYKTSFLLVNGDRFYSFGKSITNDLTLERMLSRGQRHKVSASGGFLYKNSQNYTKVLDYKVRNKVSSRDLAVAHLDLPMTFYSDYGVFYAKPGYYQGVRAFNALRDVDTNYSQKAQYTAEKLYAYYSNMFGKIQFTSSFDGQYSSDELFGSEAFLIGGEYTVRGFKEDSVQGDSGFTLRNDAKLNLATAFDSEDAVLKALTPGVFVDYGYARSNHKNIKDHRLAGAGAGLDINYGWFEGRVSYAKPLEKADWMKENGALYLYAGVGVRF